MITNDCQPLPQFSASDIERHLCKVNRSGGPDACWPWTASVDRKGYGQFGIGPFKGNRLVRAHRVAYLLAYGVDPAPFLVCHKCDNPPCCNPAHLFLGTRGDNNRDSVAKGRHTWTEDHHYRKHPELIERGEKRWNTKLTAADVIEIRRLASGAVSHQEIAAKFGVRLQTVSRVVKRERWGHVA